MTLTPQHSPKTEPLWVGRTGMLRFLSPFLFLFLVALLFLRRFSPGLFLLPIAFLLIYFFTFTSVSLDSRKLTIRRLGSTRRLSLEDIRRVRIRQNPLDRFFRTGQLLLDIRDGRRLCLRWMKEPYEGWKQVKIALYRRKTLN